MAGALRRNRHPVWGSEQRVGTDLVNDMIYLLAIALSISFTSVDGFPKSVPSSFKVSSTF